MRYSVIWLAILAVAPFSLALSFESDDYLSPHIIGGSEVTPHSHPHQVLIKINRDLFIEKGRCGGSLISPEWVISAAHCRPDETYIMYAILGAHDRKKNESTQQVTIVREFIPHPAYNPEKTLTTPDIALLKIEPTVTMNENIQPIRLPTWSQRNSWFWMKSVIVTGWGYDSYDIYQEAPTALQSIETKVVTNLYCGLRFGFSLIKSFHVCTDESNGKAAYQGDSGGPMVMTESDGKYTLIGITSFGLVNAVESYPTVFTRVASYLEWISTTTGITIRK